MERDDDLKSYNNCCRTCMKERSNMFGIFMEINSTSAAHILATCTNINVCMIYINKTRYL